MCFLMTNTSLPRRKSSLFIPLLRPVLIQKNWLPKDLEIWQMGNPWQDFIKTYPQFKMCLYKKFHHSQPNLPKFCWSWVFTGSPVYTPHPCPHFLHLFSDLAIWQAPSHNSCLCCPHSDLKSKDIETRLIKKVPSPSLQGLWVGEDGKYCYFSLQLLSHEI